MKYKFEKAPLAEINTNVLVIGVFQAEVITAVLQELDTSFAHDKQPFAKEITSATLYEGFSGKAMQIVSLPTYGAMACKKVVFIGLGPAAEFSEKSSLMRKFGAQLARRFDKASTTSLCLVWRMPAAALA